MKLAAWMFILVFILACQSLKTKPQKLPVHGHRGSRGTHPENTLPAFEEAVAAGADVLELDLHLSKNDIAFVSHDHLIPKELCKDSKGKRIHAAIPIRSLTDKQLKRYDCGSLKNPRFGAQKAVPGTKMPTLNEVLEWTSKNAPQIEFNIETKMDATNPAMNPDPKHFAEVVIAVLKKYGVIEKSILQSFDFRTLTEAKKIEPSLRLSALVEREKNFCELAEKAGAQFASPYHILLTSSEVALCHAKNIQVVPWTLNTESEWSAALDMNVDGIITDYPRRLKVFLTGNPA